MTTDVKDIGWGLKGRAPASASLVWGFRAIKTGGGIDLLHDRQDCISRGFRPKDNIDCRRRFSKFFLDSVLIPRINDAAVRLAPDSEEEWIIPLGFGIHCHINCKASYGYVYGVCWLDNTIEGGKWTAAGDPPLVGDRVVVRTKEATVLGRFVDEGYIGLVVHCDGDYKIIDVFGAELTPQEA